MNNEYQSELLNEWKNVQYTSGDLIPDILRDWEEDIKGIWRIVRAYGESCEISARELGILANNVSSMLKENPNLLYHFVDINLEDDPIENIRRIRTALKLGIKEAKALFDKYTEEDINVKD